MSTPARKSLRLSFAVLFAISVVASWAGFYPDLFVTPMLISTIWAIYTRSKFANVYAIIAGVSLVVPAWNLGVNGLQLLEHLIALGCIALSVIYFRNESKMTTSPRRAVAAVPSQGAESEEFSMAHSIAMSLDTGELAAPTSDHLSRIVQGLEGTGQLNNEQLDLVRDHVSKVMMANDDTGLFSQDPEGNSIGDYAVVKLIGEGGSSRVFLARDRYGERVAIKVLRQSLGADRFKREMECIETLAHPNISVAYEVGVHHNRPYIVMEHLEGPDLHQYVKTRGPMSPKESAQVICQAARGLAHAHQRGLVHRDVKPANLIWDGARRIKVGDLGLANTTATLQPLHAEAPDFHTIDEAVAGTPDFMSPEQARSLTAATEQSDIYSLGASWHYLLTGQSRLGEGKPREKLARLLGGNDLAELPGWALPPAVRQVFDQMIANSPGDRFASMDEVIDAIESSIISDALTSESEVPETSSEISVLVVEDDQVDLQMTMQTLNKLNQSVILHTAASLSEATEFLQRGPRVDLVLLDLMLSDSEGSETVSGLMRADSRVPVVVLSGSDDPMLADECLRLGARQIVSKNDLCAHKLERIIFIAQSRATRQPIA